MQNYIHFKFYPEFLGSFYILRFTFYIIITTLLKV